ncbi:MAG TPA: SMC-Scp complex subunit ScpB [Terracidiphilus sp.]|jgi:segregation and condensation protein B
MSLKAKLEAVIYAAEEPVTLAQFAALFAADALEWRAAHETASAAAAEETAPGGETLPLLNAEFDYQELEQPAETPAATPEETAQEAAGAETDSEAGTEFAEAAPETGAEPPADAPVDAEAEEKRLARQRDREVRAILQGLLDELIATYASDDRGIEIKEIAGGYRMATKPECHDAARMFVKSLKPAMKLSLPALETLAVIAYKQPVTAPEVNEIRGVDSSGVFGSLLARKLIATAGRKQVIGRPILYKTTKEFLLRFGLKDVQELPSMEEFEKMAQLEFEDMEPVAEEEANAVSEGLNPEVDDDPDEPTQESATSSPQEAQQGTETAVTADSNPVRGIQVGATQETDRSEPLADAPATQAETTPAEAAPAAPSPLEQAETETVPHE